MCDGFPQDCRRCNGSGEVSVSSTTGRNEKPGPVTDDARGVVAQTCPDCLGIGQIIVGDFDDE